MHEQLYELISRKRGNHRDLSLITVTVTQPHAPRQLLVTIGAFGSSQLFFCQR